MGFDRLFLFAWVLCFVIDFNNEVRLDIYLTFLLNVFNEFEWLTDKSNVTKVKLLVICKGVIYQ